jgi:hypothetical protein
LNTALARRLALGVLWLLGSWNIWECRALYSDGALFFVEVVHKGWFWHPEGIYDRSRQYAIAVSELFLVAGVQSGVTDLHWLARLQSLGAFALPTALYHFALVRAKDDAVLLTATIAAIALIFLPTSFFIIGEYNAAYAIAIATAVLLATADRPRLGDAVVLVVLSVLALRTYEAFGFLGPLLAAMVLWRTSPGRGHPLHIALLAAATMLAFCGLYALPVLLAGILSAAVLCGWMRARWRSAIAAGLCELAAALFLTSAIVAIHSGSSVIGLATVTEIASAAPEFWRNSQFDLALAAALIVVVWVIAKPVDLDGLRPYLWAGLPIAALLGLPLLALGQGYFHPLATQHYAARLACAPIVAAIIGVVWLRTAGVAQKMAKVATRRLLAFFVVLMIAHLPSQVALTVSWISFLDATRATIRSHSGSIAFAVLPAETPSYWTGGDMEFISALSLALRSSPSDGIIALPPGTEEPLPLPDIGGYFWRDQKTDWNFRKGSTN